MKTFLFGAFTFSFIIGFLVGSSQSPVVGVTITAVLSLMSVAIGYILGKQKLLTYDKHTKSDSNI